MTDKKYYAIVDHEGTDLIAVVNEQPSHLSDFHACNQICDIVFSDDNTSVSVFDENDHAFLTVNDDDVDGLWCFMLNSMGHVSAFKNVIPRKN